MTVETDGLRMSGGRSISRIGKGAPDDRPNLYLLVEESFRELDARMIVAAHAFADGWDVTIGQQWWFFENFGRLKPGVALFKGNNDIQAHNMGLAKRAGHHVASLEEEAFGLVDFGGQRLYADGIAQVCDLFLVQGEVQERFLIQQVGVPATRVAITGNPRVDILRPEYRQANEKKAAELRDQFGKFVLVNTNFASINPFDHDACNYFDRCVQVGVIDPDIAADVEAFHDWCAWERANFTELLSLIGRLTDGGAAIPLIIRPHPSENHAPWHQTFAGRENVTIIEDPDYTSWILASQAMAHTGCTTGLEAYLLGVPSVSVQPAKSSWNGNVLSNEVNQTASTAELAEQMLRDQLAGKATIALNSKDAGKRLRPHLVTDPQTPAARHIVQALEHLAADLDPCRIQDPQSDFALENTARQLKKAAVDEADFNERWFELAVLLGLKNSPKANFLAPSVARLTAGRMS